MTTAAAGLLCIASLALSVWSFRGIVLGYRRAPGFPWLPSLGFAAAATAALFALRALFFL
jgi:hypothetical protein